MNLSWIGRLLMMGLLLWTIPLVAYMGLFDKSGRLTVTYGIVKMMVIMVLPANGVVLALHRVGHLLIEIVKGRPMAKAFHWNCLTKRDMMFSR